MLGRDIADLRGEFGAEDDRCRATRAPRCERQSQNFHGSWCGWDALDDETPRLELVDQNGRPQITASLAPEGRPIFELGRANGPRSLFKMSLAPDGLPFLSFWSIEGELNMMIGAMPDGTPAIALHKGEAMRMSLGLRPDGHPNQYLFDSDGKARLALEESDSRAGLIYFDKAGKVRMFTHIDKNETVAHIMMDSQELAKLSLETMKDGFSTLSFTDQKDIHRMVLGIMSEGVPWLTISDPDAISRVWLSTTRKSEPYLEMFGADKQSVTRIPAK